MKNLELTNILDKNIIFPKSNYTSKEEILRSLAASFKKEQYIDN